MGQDVRHDAMLAESLRDQGFGVVEHYVADSTWRALAREARRRADEGDFRQAGVGRGASFRVDRSVRSDAVLWVDPNAPSRAERRWLARIERLRLALNQALFLGLFDYECHFARFGPGARYETHLDRFSDARHRLVSLVLYLNETWPDEAGGALRLFLNEPDRPPWEDVPPRGGTLVAFLSGEIAHEVRPADRERFSLTGWLTAREGATSSTRESATRRAP
jgi:SM-20-related protein